MSSTRGKLNSKERQELREILLERRRLLVGDVNHMQDSSMKKTMAAASGDLSTVPYHMADVGTDNFEHEFTLGLIENEEEELREIDAALERIEETSYGTCETCEKPIPKGRLKVIPYARLCIDCKRDQENGKGANG